MTEQTSQDTTSDPASILPGSDTDFVKNEIEGKNDTKVVMDDAHNAAFIDELRSRYSFNSTSNEDRQKIELTVEELTSSGLLSKETADSIISPKEVVHSGYCQVTQTDVDTTVVETEEEDPVSKEILDQVDLCIADPTRLKFTDKEIEDMTKLGVFDNMTVVAIAKSVDEQIEDMISGATDPDSPFFDIEERKKAVISTLRVKMSASQAITQAKELTSLEFVEEIFTKVYPDYVTRGPAHILELFLTYIRGRISDFNGMSFVVKEMNDQKKLIEIFERAGSMIFGELFTTTGTKYTTGAFVKGIFHWNRALFSRMSDTPEDKITIDKCESLILIFTAMFTRWCYKHLIPEMKTRAIQRRLFQKFVSDNSNPTNLTGDQVEWLNDAWYDVMTECSKIAVETNSIVKSK